MARILCNVAGGGKPLKGNAKTGDVLAGKTFSNKQSNALTGSMPNNGAWSSSTSGSGTVIIPAGYHNGSGGVDCSGAYNAGVAAADARVNASSASYNSGYANGWNACRQAAMANIWVSVKADAQYAGDDARVSGWGSASLTEYYGRTGNRQVDNGNNRHVSANVVSWGGMPDAK